MTGASRLAVLSLLVVMGLGRARADTPRLRLDVHPCVHVKPALVSSLVQVELKGYVSASKSAATAARVAALVRCVPAGATIEIQDEDGRPIASRTIDLGAYGEVARPRLLALTIAEMVSALWERPAADPVPDRPEARATSVPVVVPTLVLPGQPITPQAEDGPGRSSAASDPEGSAQLVEIEVGPARASARPAPETAFDLGVRVSTRKFNGSPFEFGGSVRGALAWERRLAVELDLAFERGAVDTSLGEVVSNTVSLGAWAGLRVDLEPFEVRGGVGLRGGLAVLQGSPDPDPTLRGQAVTGAWVGPMVALAGRWVWGELLVELSADAGANLVPVRALVQGEGEVASISGGWIALHVGVGWRL